MSFTSWLQSPSALILEPPKIKAATVSTVSPSISHEVMGPYLGDEQVAAVVRSKISKKKLQAKIDAEAEEAGK